MKTMLKAALTRRVPTAFFVLACLGLGLVLYQARTMAQNVNAQADVLYEQFKTPTFSQPAAAPGLPAREHA